MRFTRRRTALAIALVAVPAFGLGGMAIAGGGGGRGGPPATDRLSDTGYTNHVIPRTKKVKFCEGADGPYAEVRQSFIGRSDPGSDPRISGKVFTESWTVVRLTGLPGTPPGEPLGQTFGTLEIRDPDSGRLKAEAKFAADAEFDNPSPEGDPNPDTKPPEQELRAEGFFIGRAYGHPRAKAPKVNFGRMIANYTADAHAKLRPTDPDPDTFFELTTGDREVGNTPGGPGGNPAKPGSEHEGRDEQGNLAALQTGDCGLGSEKAFDKLFGFEGHGHGRDDDGKDRGKRKGHGKKK